MLGIMKAFVVFTVFIIVAAHAAEDFCYKDVDRACKQTTSKQDPTKIVNCNAKYGAIDIVLPQIQAFVNTHIMRSFEYLMMATHYGNYEKNREGFEKVFRGLSDSKWHEAIELMKYIGKRGGEMNFKERKPEQYIAQANDYELYELESLAKALDIEKELAKDAHVIHKEASRRHENSHDPEISSYIEEEFVHKHASNIRKLTGYTQDLMKILDGPDRSLGLYLFDEYLQKQ